MNEQPAEGHPSPSTEAPQAFLPDTLEELLSVGHQHLDEKNFLEAQRAFDKALTLEPSHVVARHNRGYALECQGAVDAAIATYEAVMQSPSPLAQSAFNLGGLLAREGRETEARHAFEQALALDPHFATAYVNLGVLQIRAGLPEEARHCFQQALEHDPACRSARLKLASLLAREERWEEALGEYTRLLEEGGNLAAVHYGRGLALTARGDEEEALQAYQRAIDADPNHVAARVQLGLLYAQRQQYEQAAETLQQAADLAPTDARIYYNLANMHARLAIEGGEVVSYSHADAAIAAYRRAIELNAQFCKAAYNLACVSEKIGVQEGLAAWEQYVRTASAVASEQEWVAKARGYLRRLKAIEAARQPS